MDLRAQTTHLWALFIDWKCVSVWNFRWNRLKVFLLLWMSDENQFFLLFFRLITNSMPENQCLFSQLIYNSFGKILFPLNLMDREVLEKWFVIFYIIFENNLFSKVFHEIQNIEISLPIFIIDLDQFWHWSFCFWSDWRIHV